MNKNYIFGIGLSLAVLLIFTAPAMAGPNTVYFEQQHSSADPDGTVDVVAWFNLTDAYGTDPEYGFSIIGMNFTWNADVLDVISCERPADDPWDAGWTIHKWHGNSWYVLAEHNPWNDPGAPYGLDPGVYPIANFTLKGINPGVTDLAFIPDTGHPRDCYLVDALGDPFPDQVWEDGTFTCVGPAKTFTKDLASGWNLVSLPLTPDDNSTSAVLGSIPYDAVKSYNAATNQFEDVTTMDPGTGYFVHVTTAGTWSYDGQPCNSISASLSTGLNCVGWTNTSAALPGALSSIAGSYRYVTRWDAGTQSYEVYLSGAPAVFNDFATMDRGEGYFIAATAGCTLTHP